MSYYVVNGQDLTSLADAVRSATGQSGSLSMGAIISGVQNLDAGGMDMAGILMGTASTLIDTKGQISYLSFNICTGNSNLTAVDLPACTIISNVSASSVSTGAFGGCTALSSVNLPVCSIIKSYTFYNCHSLSEISLPQITTLPTGIFCNCTNLKSVNAPNVTNISNSAFRIENTYVSGQTVYGRIPSDITVSDKLYYIESSAFYATYGFNTYGGANYVSMNGNPYYAGVCNRSPANISVIHTDCRFIGESAFTGRSEVNYTITCDSPSIRVGMSAFHKHTLCGITMPGCTYIGAYGFARTTLATAYFPNCSLIGGYAFESCTSLATASFNKCTSLGFLAFNSCSRLSNVALPNCEYLGSYAFSGCLALSSISLPNVKYFGYGAFGNCGITYIDLPECLSFMGNPMGAITSISLPKVTYISGLSSWSILTDINFAECQSVGKYAFYSCSNLSTVSLPKCTNIENCAFGLCSSLLSVSLPQCKSLGGYAFSNCSQIMSIDLPQCESIGAGAFSRCTALVSLSVPLISEIGDAFVGVSFPVTILNKSTIEKYEGFSWGGYGFVLPYVTTVQSMAFKTSNYYPNTTLRYISLPECLSIGTYAFDGTGVSEVYAPKCTYVGSYAFRGTSSLCVLDLASATALSGTGTMAATLTYVNIPNASVVEYAFSSCTNLSVINIDSLQSIHYYMFYNCQALQSISAPVCSNVQSYAFMACSNMSTAYLPMCTLVSSQAFYGCNKLNSINIDKCKKIYANAFYGCTSLPNIYLPDNTDIPASAFYNCTRLSYANIGKCTMIYSGAFSNCTALRSLVLDNAGICNLITTNAFTGIGMSSTNIYVQDDLVELYKAQTNWVTYSSNFLPLSELEVHFTVNSAPYSCIYNTSWTGIASANSSVFTISGNSVLYNGLTISGVTPSDTVKKESCEYVAV